MCVYQFRHPGDATDNFTFPTDTCQRSPQSPARRRAARRASRARSRRLAACPSVPSRSHAKSRTNPCQRRSRDSRRSRAGDIDPTLLPSREAILAALRNAGTPLPPADLERELAVGRVAREAFHGRLAAMERDGQLLTNRKHELCVVAKLDLVIGTVQGHPDGFGFLVPDEGGDDYFLSPREMHKVLARRSRSHPEVRHRSPRTSGRRDRRSAGAREPRNRRPLVRGARHLVRRGREPSHQPGPAHSSGRPRRRQIGPGGCCRDRPATRGEPRSDCPHQGSARQRHGFRNRNRDCAAQACAAFRVLGGRRDPGRATADGGTRVRPS